MKLYIIMFIIFICFNCIQKKSHSYFYVANEYLRLIEFGQKKADKNYLNKISQLYEKAIALEPENYVFISYYGNFLYNYGNHSKAIKILEKTILFLKKDQNKIDVYNSLSWLYSKGEPKSLRNPKKGLNYGLKLYQLLNQNWGNYNSYKVALYLDTIATAYYVNKKYILAKDFILQALKLSENTSYKKKIERRAELYLKSFKSSLKFKSF